MPDPVKRETLTPEEEADISTRESQAEQTPLPEKPNEPRPAMEKGFPETPSVEALAKPAAPPAPVAPAAKDPVLSRVEGILAEDLADIYRELPEGKREKFNTRGDEVAPEVFDMIHRAKASAKKILKLISDWLKMIPGINRFFLEQEAKIKTDKLMAMAELEKEKKK